MPKYTVQDETTGKTVTFDWQGDAAPTDSDYEEVFKSAREFVSEKNKPSEQAPTYEQLLGQFPHGIPTPTPVSVEMIKNFPQSALNLGVGVAKALGNIPGTAKAIGRAAAGGIEKLTGAGTGENIPDWESFSQGMKERYGGLSNLYKTMETDPAGFLTDVSTLASGAGAVTRIGSLKNLARGTNVLYGGTKGIGRGLGKAEDVVVGALSGSTAKTIRQAKQWSTDFQNMLRGNVSGKDMVGRIKDALGALGDKEYAAYSQSLSKIDDAGIMVNPQEIFSRYDELLRSIRVRQNPDGNLNFVGSNLERQTAMQSELKKIHGYLRDRTVDGIPYEMLPSEIDAMKKWIWTEKGKIDPKRNAPVHNLAKQLYGATEQTLEKQVPSYAELVAKSKKYLEWEEDFEKAFSLGDKTNIEATMTKFRTTAKDDKFFRQELAKDFRELTGTDLEAMIAGLDLSVWMPRGLYGRSMATGAALGAFAYNPLLGAALPFTFPRIAGEMMQVQGLAGRGLKKIPSQTPNILYQAGQVRERSKPKSVLYGGE